MHDDGTVYDIKTNERIKCNEIRLDVQLNVISPPDALQREQSLERGTRRTRRSRTEKREDSFLLLSPSSSFLLRKVEIESMTRYVSPVNPAVFPLLAVVLLGIGVFFTAWFFVYEVTSTKFTRDICKEALISLVAALFSSFGVLFLLLWVGIYV
ncbi:Protein NEF1 [Trachymyrmex septentrionalis]|uniref:Dolichyl-diphosphooligosaccharide-protein glycosyltransferase subunit TMEM258 n=1 Tax=Trachymyrmex septentrionalis TaxID=34720 RepID=A0A195FET1_9HYME|nr:Protein NEF1 [Trachymyrmex septentrionalis]